MKAAAVKHRMRPDLQASDNRRTSPASKKSGATKPPTPGQISELWQRLRAARRFADLRQQDVSDELTKRGRPKSRATIALWESAEPSIRTEPGAEDVRTLAEIYGVPVAFIMDNGAHPDDVWRLKDDKGATSTTPSAVREPTPAYASMHTTALGLDDRRALNFWSAVEFNVVERNPSLAECFMHNTPQKVAPDFLKDGNAVVFASDCATPQSILSAAMTVLLHSDRASGHTLVKHVLVFVGKGAPIFNEGEVEKQWGTHVRQVDNLKDASKYLAAL